MSSASVFPRCLCALKIIAGTRMTSAANSLITARTFRTQDANRQDARGAVTELIAAPIASRPSAGPAAEPGCPGGAGRRKKAARHGQGGARKGDIRGGRGEEETTKYDFTIPPPTKPRSTATSPPPRRADRGRARPIANMANVAALIWEPLPDLNWAGFYRNLGGELVLGPFRAGRPASASRSARACAARPRRRASPAGRRCSRLSRPHRLRRRLALRAGGADPRATAQLLGVLDLDSPTRRASTRKTRPAASAWLKFSPPRFDARASKPRSQGRRSRTDTDGSVQFSSTRAL